MTCGPICWTDFAQFLLVSPLESAIAIVGSRIVASIIHKLSASVVGYRIRSILVVALPVHPRLARWLFLSLKSLTRLNSNVFSSSLTGATSEDLFNRLLIQNSLFLRRSLPFDFYLLFRVDLLSLRRRRCWLGLIR